MIRQLLFSIFVPELAELSCHLRVPCDNRGVVQGLGVHAHKFAVGVPRSRCLVSVAVPLQQADNRFVREQVIGDFGPAFSLLVFHIDDDYGAVA